MMHKKNMNMINKIILFLLLQFVFIASYSQNSQLSTFNIEFKSTLNKTKHLNSPISINTYFEGGRILNQDARLTNSYEVYLNLRNQNHIEYRFGIGLTKIHFNQTREDWIGIAPDFVEVINEEVHYKFVNLLLGGRKYFSTENRLKPLIGLIIICDKNLKEDFQVKYGFSIEAEIGIEYSICDQLLISSNLLYRNAILPYNRNKNYYPILWGIGIGLKYQLNTHHNTR
jgi:hypothetical protein